MTDRPSTYTSGVPGRSSDPRRAARVPGRSGGTRSRGGLARGGLARGGGVPGGWGRRGAVARALAGVVVASALTALPAVVAGQARADVLTNMADAGRSGWYPDQASLSPSTVSGGSFGELVSPAPVVGQVYAQPLVSSNTLLVATEANNVYGFDPKTLGQRWTRNLGRSFDPTVISCGDISPEVGVTSTPAIDAGTGTAYVMSKTYLADGVTPAYFLHAMDLVTGAEKPNFPVRIQGTADNDPNQSFLAKTELQRPGLLLMNGVVYAGFGAHCDRKPYWGWVIGVSTAGQITSMWSDEANQPINSSEGPGAGIWESGNGLTSDGPGQILVSTGNGLSPTVPGPGHTVPDALGQSIIRLTVQSDGRLKATDYFSPYNNPSLNLNDSDLGSGGILRLPDSFGTTAHPKLLAVVGKAGYTYLLDSANLGGFQNGNGGADDVVAAIGANGGVWGKPAAWPGDGGWVYETTAQGGGGSGFLKAFKYSLNASGVPTLALVGRSGDQFGFGSSSPIVTSDATTSGSALIWVIWSPAVGAGGTTPAPSQLRAYDPVPVNGTLPLRYSAPIGIATKFAPPTVDNGKVYVATKDGRVHLFGSPVVAPLTGDPVTLPDTVIGSTATATATLTATKPLTVTAATVGAGPFSRGTTTPALPATLPAGGTLTVPVSFAPTQYGAQSAQLDVQTDAGPVSVGITGFGQTAGPHLVQYPCCISFGGAVVNAPGSNATATFTNDGAAPLTVSAVTRPGAPYAVTGMPAVGDVVMPGQSVTATVTFSPTAVGSFNDNLSLDSDGGQADVSLSGSGGTPPAMTISPMTVDFGPVPVGGTLTKSFTVTNTGGTDLTVTKSKPPLSGTGFTATTNLPEASVIPAGQTATETVAFSPAVSGPLTDTWTITSNDGTGVQVVTFNGTGTKGVPPTLTIGDVDIVQPTGGTATAQFPVTLSAPQTVPVTVQYSTKDGSALSGLDYVGIPLTTLTFPAGVTQQVVPVTVNATQVVTDTKTFTVNLAKPTVATLADGSGKAYVSTGTFPPLSVGVDDTTVSAPASGATATLTFPVSVSPAPLPGQVVTITATAADGTLTAAAGDYTPTTTTLTFDSTHPLSQTVSVPVLHAPPSGTNGTVKLALTTSSAAASLSDASALGTVVGGTPPTPSLYIADTPLQRPAAGTAPASVTVRLSRPSTGTVSVKYATKDGNLVAPGDYVAQTGTLTFAPGETSKQVNVLVNGSSTAVGVQYLTVGLSGQSGASLGDSGAKVYVVSPSVHTFVGIADQVVTQGATADVTAGVQVFLEAPSGQPTTVTLTTVDGTATVAHGDYVPLTNQAVTVPAGQTSVIVPITVKADPVARPNRTFTVTVGGASGLTKIADGSALVTVLGHA